MAVLLVKKKPALKEPEQLSELAGLIDEIGAEQAAFERRKGRIKKLEEAQDVHKAKVKRLQELVEELDEHADDEGFVELGAEFQAEFGKKGCSRRITDIRQVQKLMGDQIFYEVCSVNLKDIDDYLTPEERKEVVATDRGLRGVKIVRR